MLISMTELRERHGVWPEGILHLGGHIGEEAESYCQAGALCVMWFECNPLVLPTLEANVARFPFQMVIDVAVSDTDGEVVEFNISSNNASSSILPMKKHRDYYPDITEQHTLLLRSRTVDAIFQERDYHPLFFNFANLDLQGAELKALKGMQTVLPHLKWIYTEVNFEELYAGCPLVSELDDYLAGHNFRRVDTVDTGCGWGDALYTKVGSQP